MSGARRWGPWLSCCPIILMARRLWTSSLPRSRAILHRHVQGLRRLWRSTRRHWRPLTVRRRRPTQTCHRLSKRLPSSAASTTVTGTCARLSDVLPSSGKTLSHSRSTMATTATTICGTSRLTRARATTTVQTRRSLQSFSSHEGHRRRKNRQIAKRSFAILTKTLARRSKRRSEIKRLRTPSRTLMRCQQARAGATLTWSSPPINLCGILNFVPPECGR
mmetsp:Transcript_48651/g.135981  ORF Transcript_48651/g.135981 Transcript_48651/m.135981 type:complete len:220 (-) Transcript_48651:115-774(-)